jgi:serine/threonine-protein kinase RsbT
VSVKGENLDNKVNITIPIKRDTDIVLACQKGRTLAAQLGLAGNDQVSVVIAVSEIARNILRYAERGTIVFKSIQENETPGIMVIAQDEGPGIADLNLVLQDGYSTGGGLGLGLSGAKRLMDDFEIVSEIGRGTTITMIKWR